jgi:tetratricopeptide (TPR) repeat protein
MLLIAVVCACADKPANPVPSFIVGVEPAMYEVGTNDYYDIVKLWHSKGFRNRTLIHISPYDGLEIIPEDRFKAIKDSLEGIGSTAAVRETITSRNYLNAALRFGILKEIFWVIPFDHLDYIDAEARVKQFLSRKSSYFDKNDIDAMAFTKGCVSGRLSGVKTHICSTSTLPRVNDSVIFTINDSFFSVMAASKKRNILGVIKLFFDDISSKKLKTDSLSIIQLHDEMARRGYIYEEIREMFSNPDTAGKSLPPELWRLRDQADNMLNGGGIIEALALLKKRGHEYPDDRYLILMKATAELLLGMNNDGMRTIGMRCPEEKMFCRGLVDVGVILKNQGKNSEAADIFARVIKLDTGNSEARIELGRLKDSIAVK